MQTVKSGSINGQMCTGIVKTEGAVITAMICSTDAEAAVYFTQTFSNFDSAVAGLNQAWSMLELLNGRM